MDTKTALGLLGPLASQEVQRRYIVRGTRESYLLATEALNEAAYFVRYPRLGAAKLLSSVREFARVLEESATER